MRKFWAAKPGLASNNGGRFSRGMLVKSMARERVSKRVLWKRVRAFVWSVDVALFLGMEVVTCCARFVWNSVM